MASSQDKMKEFFNQFVDTLVQDELEVSRQEMIQQKNDIIAELQNMKNDIFKKIEDVKVSTDEKILQLSNTIEQIKHEVDDTLVKESVITKDEFNAVRSEIETQVSQVNGTIKKLAISMTEAFTQHDEEFTAHLDSLDQRVSANETQQNSTRDDHGKISMLLNTFASQITTTTTQSIPAIRDDQPLPMDDYQEPVITPIEDKIEEPSKPIEEKVDTINEHKEIPTVEKLVEEPTIVEEFQITSDFEDRPFAGIPEATGESDIHINPETGQHLYK